MICDQCHRDFEAYTQIEVREFFGNDPEDVEIITLCTIKCLRAWYA